MVNYDYECQSCGRFEYSQVIGSKALEQCPVCGKPCERLISGGIHASVRGEVTTIGQQMERNTKKMGKYKLEELAPEKAEQSSPSGLTKEKFKKITKMTPEQKKKYIMEGK